MRLDNSSRRGTLWIPVITGFCLSMFMMVDTAVAKSPAQDKKKKLDSLSVQIVFSERDREIIHDYYSPRYSGLPPGLAQRGGNLPPGLEKHLRRNARLPPGLQKKVEHFPYELERRLPPLPRNYVRVILGGRGLIVDAQFNILDIFEIFR